MRKDDPCIRICEFHRQTGWCKGCGVSVAEIRGWKKQTPYRRKELLRDLGRRVAQLKITARKTG
ncbi:DUF1289 domain-containing protein [Shinella sp. H4-D48]|uniref:DUF1289 domain-containing protein n=1 Tax=Shinella sp. H4-D48 TaxID=2925841 RepID=UPI001F53C1B5|nr:DUF1289 domain-containing protein [Shinella sp. H4-D48]UNK37692.1 DUF1289 domain-containing protein [Shinella sp. H4-D48]